MSFKEESNSKKGERKMNMNAVLVEKTSKNGNKYVCIEVYLTDKVKKIVFLNDSEVELIKLWTSSTHSTK